MRGVLHQGTEERWQQPFQIAAGRACHLAGEERHGVLEQVEQAAQLVEISHRLGRRVLDGHLLAEGEDRQLRRAHPRHADQLDHVLQQALVLPRALGGHQDAGQAVVRGGDDASFRGVGGGEDAEAVLLELAGDLADAVAGHGIGLDIAVDDEDGEFEVFVHCAPLKRAATEAGHRSLQGRGPPRRTEPLRLAAIRKGRNFGEAFP
ncbi:hypothetical protein D9M68_297520 [compost metagenome]